MVIDKAKKIVSVLNTVYGRGSAVIAGGYVRDLATGRKPKDIDIITSASSVSARDLVRALSASLDLSHMTHAASGSGNGDTSGQLVSVCTLKTVGDMSIDVIFCSVSVMDRIRNFPCNASMVWLGDDEEVESLPQFDKFIQTGTLEFYGSCTKEYAERMNEYYSQNAPLLISDRVAIGGGIESEDCMGDLALPRLERRVNAMNRTADELDAFPITGGITHPSLHSI